MRNLFFILLLLLIFNRCVQVDGYSPAQQILISKEPPNTAIEIKLVEGKPLVKSDYCELNFEKVKEGGTYLFGKMVMGVVADDYPRFEIWENGEILAKYSINEIKKMDYDLLADSVKVFKIPELE